MGKSASSGGRHAALRPARARGSPNGQSKASATAAAAASREGFLEALKGLLEDKEMHKIIRFEGGVLSVFSKARVLEALKPRYNCYGSFARQLNYYHFKLHKQTKTGPDEATYSLGMEVGVRKKGADSITVLNGLPRKKSRKKTHRSAVPHREAPRRDQEGPARSPDQENARDPVADALNLLYLKHSPREGLDREGEEEEEQKKKKKKTS